jgi:uncharacterized repeat protein (TIGR01451 family)
MAHVVPHPVRRGLIVSVAIALAVGALAFAAPSAAFADDPVLTVSNTVSEPMAHPGDQITYTISIVNSGTTDATGYYLHDYLSNDLTFDSATGSPGNIDFFGIPGYTETYVWFGSITVPHGQTLTETLTATVNPGTEGDSITNGALVDLGGAVVTHETPCTGLPFTGSCAPTSITPALPAITVAVQSCALLDTALCDPTVDSDWVGTTHFPTGSLVSFRVVVANTGDGTLTGVSTAITTALAPEGTPVVSAGTATFPTWSIGTLAHAAIATLTFRAQLPATAGPITIAAQVSATGGTTAVSDSATSTVTGTPVLAETGVDLGLPFGGALLLIFGGLVLIPLRRRTRTTRQLVG